MCDPQINMSPVMPARCLAGVWDRGREEGGGRISDVGGHKDPSMMLKGGDCGWVGVSDGPGQGTRWLGLHLCYLGAGVMAGEAKGHCTVRCNA